MKYQLFSTSEGFEAEIYDEQKMIPDPAFRRVFRFHGVPVLDPRGPEESEKDFEIRAAAAAAELEAYRENMRAESLRLYLLEFVKLDRVVVDEAVL